MAYCLLFRGLHKRSRWAIIKLGRVLKSKKSVWNLTRHVIDILFKYEGQNTTAHMTSEYAYFRRTCI